MERGEDTAGCFICGSNVSELCVFCGDVWCCAVHRHSHAGRGETQCYPFRVEDSQEAGRYLVATRTISKGEVVMSDYPVVCGPIYTRTKPVCLNCLKLATADSYRCSKCDFPVCGQECEEGVWHENECRVFQAAGYKGGITSCEELCPVYSCVTPLRILLLKKFSPQAWSIVDTFMDHDQDRARKDSPAWKIHELLVVNFIHKSLKLEEFSQSDIRRAIGILRTNSVKLDLRKGHGDGVAVYPTYSYANHSCVCNSHTRKYKDRKLELVAQSQINPGDQIWTRYTTPQLGSFQRVSDIQKTWHFTCSCARCKDPTEFGTMMSALRCNVTDCQGFLLPRCPTLIGSPWRCGSCAKTMGVSGIQPIMKMVLDNIATHRNDDNEGLLNLIKTQEEVLHPNHYLIMGVKEIIIQRLMVAISGYHSNSTSSASSEQMLADYKLRTVLFRDVATVLEEVDSVGAGWMEKLGRMMVEEQEIVGQINKTE
eukprot:GFUD01015169.1.p1 GENE.GFUD01015169.1~~GFUD01015169.1.p1  ORF type:complete len:507 (+),score=138.21 GFUD01015169.1:76-1521(+)